MLNLGTNEVAWNYKNPFHLTKIQWPGQGVAGKWESLISVEESTFPPFLVTSLHFPVLT